MANTISNDFLWAAASTGNTATKQTETKSSSAKEDFSKILNEMRTGQIDKKELEKETQDGKKDLSVVTRTMSDGSTVVIVMLGNKILSERKFGGDPNGNKDARLVDTNTQMIGKIGSDGKGNLTANLNSSTDQTAAAGGAAGTGDMALNGGLAITIQ